MKKFLVVVLSVFMCVFGLFGCTNDRVEGDIYVYTPDGAAAISLAYMMANKSVVNNTNVHYNVINPTLIASTIARGDADIMVMPSNAAANLYKDKNSGEVLYQLAAAVTHGNLFLVGEGIESMADLKGKVVGCFGQNSIPDLVFRHLIAASGLQYEIISNLSPVANKVAIRYYDSGTTIYNTMAAQDNAGNSLLSLGVLAEPDATRAVSLIDNASVLLDMQEVWEQLTEISGYPQAVLMVKSGTDREFVEAFLDSMDDTWAINNPTAAVNAISGCVEGGGASTIGSLNAAQVRGCNAYVKTDDLPDYISNSFVKLGIASPAADFYY